MRLFDKDNEEEASRRASTRWPVHSERSQAGKDRDDDADKDEFVLLLFEVVVVQPFVKIDEDEDLLYRI